MKETEYTEYMLREFELTSLDDVSCTSFIQNMALHTISIYDSLVIIIHYVPWMLELAHGALNTSISLNSEWVGGWGGGGLFHLSTFGLKDARFPVM